MSLGNLVAGQGERADVLVPPRPELVLGQLPSPPRTVAFIVGRHREITEPDAMNDLRNHGRAVVDQPFPRHGTVRRPGGAVCGPVIRLLGADGPAVLGSTQSGANCAVAIGHAAGSTGRASASCGDGSRFRRIRGRPQRGSATIGCACRLAESICEAAARRPWHARPRKGLRLTRSCSAGRLVTPPPAWREKLGAGIA